LQSTNFTRQCAYLGTGVGLALFVVYGFLPGMMLGGSAAVSLGGMLFGLPLEAGIVSRILVLAGMLAGVLMLGILIMSATTAIGWIVGIILRGPDYQNKNFKT
jgi:hypothetical protein